MPRPQKNAKKGTFPTAETLPLMLRTGRSHTKSDVPIFETTVDNRPRLRYIRLISLVKGVSRDDPETAARAVPAGGLRNPALGRLRATTDRH
jgi:hypothetical protein